MRQFSCSFIRCLQKYCQKGSILHLCHIRTFWQNLAHFLYGTNHNFIAFFSSQRMIDHIQSIDIHSKQLYWIYSFPIQLRQVLQHTTRKLQTGNHVLHIGRITHNQGTSDQCIMAILQAGDFAAIIPFLFSVLIFPFIDLIFSLKWRHFPLFQKVFQTNGIFQILIQLRKYLLHLQIAVKQIPFIIKKSNLHTAMFHQHLSGLNQCFSFQIMKYIYVYHSATETVKTNGHIKFKPASAKKEQHIQSNRRQKAIDNAHILGTIHLWGMCALPQQRSNCQRK